MIIGMQLETCWAFNKFWNNKFYYKVASCWLFLLILTTMHGSMNIKVILTIYFYSSSFEITEGCTQVLRVYSNVQFKKITVNDPVCLDVTLSLRENVWPWIRRHLDPSKRTALIPSNTATHPCSVVNLYCRETDAPAGTHGVISNSDYTQMFHINSEINRNRQNYV